MTSKTWEYDKIRRLHIELSTHCNAACPFCPRTASYEDGSSIPFTRPSLDLSSITYDDFVKWFPPEFASKLTSVLFCGSNGDPMMCKDVLSITRYLCEFGVEITFHTNGGMRNNEFWIELAQVLKINPPKYSPRRVVFSIDGLEDTNHLYRVNVPFAKAFEHAKAFIGAGGVAIWEFLIFEHNEHQIQEAQHLASASGFAGFTPKKALGFSVYQGWRSTMIVRTRTGEVSHILAPPRDKKNSIYTGDIEATTREHEPKVDVETYMNRLRSFRVSMDLKRATYEQLKTTYIPTPEESSTNVVCKALVNWGQTDSQELFIDASGRVHPCCWVGTRMQADLNMATDLQLETEVDNFGRERISLKNYTLKEIIESGYLSTVFSSKWGKKFPEGMIYCNEICGTESAIDKIYSHEDVDESGRSKNHITELVELQRKKHD